MHDIGDAVLMIATAIAGLAAGRWFVRFRSKRPQRCRLPSGCSSPARLQCDQGFCKGCCATHCEDCPPWKQSTN